MQLEDFTHGPGEWLQGAGPQSDIVISSRIRLARNLADYPFMTRASSPDRQQIERFLRGVVLGIGESSELMYVDLETIRGLDRQFLVERHLISRELAEGRSSRAVAIAEDETYSVMVNEEDHLRLQSMQSGLNLAETWQRTTASPTSWKSGSPTPSGRSWAT